MSTSKYTHFLSSMACSCWTDGVDHPSNSGSFLKDTTTWQLTEILF